MADQIPPAYSSQRPGAPPPTYTAPTQFNIGLQRTSEPLVNISQVKNHLALLHAFAELKRQVEGLQEAIPHMPADLERRWAWFVALAVERFDIWCHRLRSSDAAEKALEVTLPPIDVIMVWHAYMLNPVWYAEDCMRLPVCQILKAIGSRFSAALDGQLQSILSTPPSQARQDFWLTKTALPFDHIQSSYELINKTIYCPHCRAYIIIDMMTHQGSGYLQQKFSTSCPRRCSSNMAEITKDTLALRKMSQDLASPPESRLAGTLFNPSSTSASTVGKEIKAQICRNAQVSTTNSESTQYDESSCIGIINFAQFSMSTLKAQILTPQVDASRRITTRILSAYVDDKDYSVELVGAVLRQGSFVKKMHDLGWTRPGFFNYAGDELALQHAISRYHAFLDLMASSPASFFVPTLDIDLVWHTHQLMSGKYKSDCTTYVGRFIDHDDKVEGLRLSSAFDITCRAWKERFHVQYSHCGCPIPGDSIGQKLIRLLGAIDQAPSHLLPFNRPDLLSGTHPSDHNAVHFQSTNPRAHILAMLMYGNLTRRKRQEAQKAAEKAMKRAARSGSAQVPALLPPHAPRLQTPARNTARNTDSGSSLYAYETAFLVPVPLFATFGVGVGLAGCVAPDGGYIINPSGACGSGGLNGGAGCGGTGGGLSGSAGGGGGGSACGGTSGSLSACGGSSGGGGCGGGGGGGGGGGCGGGGGGGGCGGGGG